LFILATMAAISVSGQAVATDEEVPAFDDFRIISERNIFSARSRVGRTEEKRGQKRASAPAATIADINVVGIVKTGSRRSSIAVVESDGKHLLCHVGDTVAGLLLTEIRASEVFFEAPDGTQTARIKPGVVRDRAIATEPPPVTNGPFDASRRHHPERTGRRLPVDPVEIKDLTKKLPLVARVEDGQVLGVQLTRDVMGLREGDRLVHVGGQSLCAGRPCQRLWQIASKYRQCGTFVPEIPLTVERNSSTFEFILVPAGQAPTSSTTGVIHGAVDRRSPSPA
jgi:type II secretory pathway component PulC